MRDREKWASEDRPCRACDGKGDHLCPDCVFEEQEEQKFEDQRIEDLGLL